MGWHRAERVLVYRLAVESGLRAGELRSCTLCGSFILEGGEPSVTISAAYAKNRREDTLPLRADTAARSWLRIWRAKRRALLLSPCRQAKKPPKCFGLI